MASPGSSRSGLAVDAARFADCQLVTVNGRVDHTNSDQFGAALDAAAREVPRGGGMVVDLAGLEFITSAGLRALLLAQRTVSAAGARLVVCGIKGVVGEVFRISRFDTLLKVAGSTAGAIGEISPAAAEAFSG
jgi:anti-anti-sigma factor